MCHSVSKVTFVTNVCYNILASLGTISDLDAIALQVLYWLSGLTCTDENFIIKSGAQHAASSEGIALISPDTSPSMSLCPKSILGSTPFVFLHKGIRKKMHVLNEYASVVMFSVPVLSITNLVLGGQWQSCIGSSYFLPFCSSL